MLKKLILSGVIAFALVAVVATRQQAQAGLLENAYLTINNPLTAAVGVTHNFYFQVIQTTMGSATFQYCVTPSGSCADSGADGTSGAALGTYTDGGGAFGTTFTWTWTDASWTWSVTSTSTAEATSAGNVMRFEFTSMGNPVLGNCTHNAPSNGSTGTCYVRINAYPSTNYVGTPDSTIVSLTVTQAVTVSARVDPTFTFTVEGTTGDGSTAANGTTLTNAITTTVTTIPFGNLTANTEKFAAHALTVTTNTVGGYTIAARMTTNLTGTAYGDDIDPFTGSGANQVTPQSWLLPTGTVSGTNTGWLGVGTDDTGVTGQASNKFFSLNTTDFVVAKSNTSASTRVSKIVYGIEVNAFQEADNYTGTLLYTATPVY